MKIKALHEFHDLDYSIEWAEKFTPTPERISLFETILDSIANKGEKEVHVLELGIGPGYLAKYLLSKLDNITYEGLDFSSPMLKIASKRLANYKDRIVFTQADLTNDNWAEKLRHPPKIIVSTWALHDLFNQQNILSVYKNTILILQKGGIFLNGDFIKPEESNAEYEGGRIKPSSHLALLKSAGFKAVKCLKEFEKNLHNPTTSNNYACFYAEKR